MCSPRSGFAEATWILVVKSLVIFLVIFAIDPGAHRRRAQGARSLPGALRAQPGWPVRARAAPGRRAQADRARSPTSRTTRNGPWGSRAGDRRLHRHRDARDPALRRMSRTRRSASMASTSRSAFLYFFAFGSIAFYGLLLGGWASGSKYSFLGAMRSAAQLISYEISMGLALLGAIYDGRDAVADRDGRGPGPGSGPPPPSLSASSASWGRRLRRGQPERRSTSPRPTPSSSPGYQTEYGGMRFGSYMNGRVHRDVR